MKISGIYKITNTVTGDFYIGSSNNVKRRWSAHKWKSVWNKYPNNQMYLDMQKFGVNNFVFEILEIVEESLLKEKEQHYIELLKPTYNQMNAKGLNIERRKEACRKASRKYEKYERRKEYNNKYNNQLCSYNGQTLTLNALRTRFWKQGLSNPTAEAKKYLIL